MANLNELKSNLIEKIDDLFWFNIQNKTDGISYDFGQYRLNKLYKPLVKYFIDQFMESLWDYSNQDAKKIIWLFTDFFSLYYNNWDFWYLKNKFSSYEYRIPYSWKDTEFRWATKDCYYVKTSDVVDNMNVNIWWLLENKEVQIKMYKKTESIGTDTGDIKYNFDIRIDDIYDEDENIIWYNLYFINADETKTAASSSIFQNKISEVLNEKWIDYKNSNPLLKKSVEDFMKKRWRDYFIHKRLKDFLTEELEWYFFQMLKNDIQSKTWILDIQNKIEEIKVKYSDDPDVVEFKIWQLMKESNPEFKWNVYQEAYLWIKNYINIIADLEEFKAKIWTKKRKAIKQEYCISLWKIKELETLIPKREHILNYIFENEKQIQEWKDLWMSDNPSVDDDSLVVDTKNFEWEQRENLINLVNEDSIIWRLYNSDNYQALSYMEEDNAWKIDCIYIDPPYNTWNDWFVYKDWYNESSRLSMMSERLKKSKQLLSQHWSIFISIDDNEIANLKVDCDYIFWKENLMKLLVWESWKPFWFKATKTTRPRIHEYILHYAKSVNNVWYNPTYGELISSAWEKVLTGSLIKVESDKIYSMDFIQWAKESVSCMWLPKFWSWQKPKKLIEKFIIASTNENWVVLDFFAWSGTTWHAIMNLNKDTWCHRKFILVELWKYFDSITLKRIQKILYSQNWKDWKAIDNDGTQWIVEYTKLNQYEDWFNDWGYLDKIEWDISELSNKTIDSENDIKEILYPLNDLKHRIYNLDDEIIK